MASALNAWQAALYARLDSQLATPVYDYVPPGAAFPYVQIGEDIMLFDSAKVEDSVIVQSDIHVWSVAEGAKECKDIMSNIRTALHRQESGLSVTGWNVTFIDCTNEFVYRDSGVDGGDHYYHGVIQFRAKLWAN